MELDIEVLGRLIKAVIDRELHEQDTLMQMLAWQTAYLMNSTGNYKRPVKPEKLYTPLEKRKEEQKPQTERRINVEREREELKKRFNIKD